VEPVHLRRRIQKAIYGSFITGVIGLTNVAHGFDLQGHRGARGLMPENTLPGFATALAIGVTTLELDLAVTRDLQVVVSHNPRIEPELAREADGEWLQQSGPSIHSMTLQQVKSYDVGRLNPALKYAQRYPRQQGLDDISIPTLGEVFELVNKSGNQSVGFNIEIKINPDKPQLTLSPGEFVAAVIKVVRRYKMEQRVSLQFGWSLINSTNIVHSGQR
jgi:glycerophosphoryl diester phosphodiesterase